MEQKQQKLLLPHPQPLPYSQLKLGRFKPVWRIKGTNRARIYLGPDIKFFIGLLGFLTVASICHLIFITRPLYFWLQLGIFVLMVCSYLATALLDPGLPQQLFFQRERLIEGEHNCDFCMIRMKEKTRHCDVCEVCIEGHDHHCPWVSKCVGRGTFIHFIVFVVLASGWLIFTLFTFATEAQRKFL